MHSNPDSAFINFSYLSEKWLANYFQNYKSRHPEKWTDTYERHLEDEIRHTQMCSAMLDRSEGYREDDLKFSIQEMVYRQYGGLDLNRFDSLDAFLAVNRLIERRALVLYKSYVRYGENVGYRALIKAILNDEDRHHKTVQNLASEEFVFQEFAELDRKIWTQLSLHYGREHQRQRGIINPKFWTDLFSDKLGTLNG